MKTTVLHFTPNLAIGQLVRIMSEKMFKSLRLEVHANNTVKEVESKTDNLVVYMSSDYLYDNL